MNTKNIVIRADASFQIGMGHVMRCMSLAYVLKQRGYRISFICRNLPGNLIGYLQKNKFFVQRLNCQSNYKKGSAIKCANFESQRKCLDQDLTETIEYLIDLSKIKWVVVDNYSIDKIWESSIRPYTDRILVIDDYSDREHDCDIILNQNIISDDEYLYRFQANPECVKLIGPEFSILRPEFKKYRSLERAKRRIINRILIFFGGTDYKNCTSRALNSVEMIKNSNFIVDVIVGKQNPHKENIKSKCESMPRVNFYCQAENVAELMVKADLAIGAGGITTWERCVLGLPSIILTVAENQVEIAKQVAKEGAAVYLGASDKVSESDIYNQIKLLLKSPEIVENMSQRARDLTDGNGSIKVADAMEKLV